ncbi:hypothetical protein SCP_0800510 [Sparassis crispa]|uniref:Uncharacterized protein n=1 Tax=Sparassis crispa TaxID=139825 RepID=A0A401GUX3_9APHY|nr:hypothetical protein SCP_0800510 [Sparassis crispa]GBE85534.1 hypothetical protein SCP_0800510 [Sparassis crispa]
MEWGNWKFIVEERDELGSDDAFWEVYSNENGERLRYQQILDKLKARRADQSACDAAAAHSYFDGNLERADANGAFRYHKRGVWYTHSKDTDIAKHWRSLLKNSLEIAHSWASMQVMSVPSASSSVNMGANARAAA